MYKKYRVYVQTRRGGYAVAASNTVNDLVGLALEWLENTSAGRSVYDDMVQAVIIYKLDEKTGAYIFSEQLPASSRKDILTKLRLLGGR